MKNRKINLIILICLIIIPIGCNKEPYKEIVIEEDVNVDNNVLTQPIATGQIQLNLEKDAIFHPLYYLRGEIFGYIGMGRKPSEIDKIRRYIYKVNRLNKLEETSREYTNFLLSKQDMEFDINFNSITDNIEYNDSMKTLDLHYRINKLKEKNEGKSYEVNTIFGNDDFIIIREKTGDLTEKVYLYDNNAKVFYSPSIGVKGGEICYVSTLGAFIWVDQQDFKMYKIILKSPPFYLKDDFYYLEEYVDLGIEDSVSRVRPVMKNDDEMILFQDRIINKDGVYEDSHLYETNLVTKFVFSTNQYNYVYRKPTENNIYIEYLGYDILSVEEFEPVDNRYIIPKFRRIFRMVDRVVNLIYQEEFKEKSEQFYPTNKIIIRQDGHEIFSTRTITNIEDNKKITNGVIYQKIDISNEKLGDRND